MPSNEIVLGTADFEWEAVRYTILREPTGAPGAAWGNLPRRRVSFFDPDPGAPWALERLEPVSRWESPIYGPRERGLGLSAGETMRVFRIAWPLGGVFLPSEQSEAPFRYRLQDRVEAILLDLQKAARGGDAETRGFVSRWGRLGIGIPEAPDFGWDGVAFTRERLAELCGRLQMMRALGRGPKGDDPAAREQFIEQFRKILREVQIDLRPAGRGFVARVRPRTLYEALGLHLWSFTTGRIRLRSCRECGVLFGGGRKDRVFCTHACATKRGLRVWRQERRRRKRRRRNLRRRPRNE